MFELIGHQLQLLSCGSLQRLISACVFSSSSSFYTLRLWPRSIMTWRDFLSVLLRLWETSSRLVCLDNWYGCCSLWMNRHGGGEDFWSSWWNLAWNLMSDNKVKSTLHFPLFQCCDLLHSPLGATIILSSAENLLKKYLTSSSFHRKIYLLYLLDLFSHTQS